MIRHNLGEMAGGIITVKGFGQFLYLKTTAYHADQYSLIVSLGTQRWEYISCLVLHFSCKPLEAKTVFLLFVQRPEQWGLGPWLGLLGATLIQVIKQRLQDHLHFV